MDELVQIYDKFNQTIAEGKLDESLVYRSAEVKTSFVEYTKTPEDREGTLEMLKAMIPVSHTVDYVDDKGTKATVYMTGLFNNPEEPGKTVKQGMNIDFIKEADGWKMGTILYTASAESLKKSADENNDPDDQYEMDSNLNMAGQILDIKFEKDYTLVSVKMLDEADLIFLPAKENLGQVGLKESDLAPYRIIEVEGHKHKNNPLKIKGINAKIIQPE